MTKLGTKTKSFRLNKLWNGKENEFKAKNTSNTNKIDRKRKKKENVNKNFKKYPENVKEKKIPVEKI